MTDTNDMQGLTLISNRRLLKNSFETVDQKFHQVLYNE